MNIILYIFTICFDIFRFVYLNDCGHSIESEALERWMYQNDEEITLKQCPLCKTPILKTQRFTNQVKVILEDISKIKIKQYGELYNLKHKKKIILNSLRTLDKKFYSTFIGEVNQSDFVKDLWDILCQPLLALLDSLDRNKNKNNKSSKRKSQFSLPVNDVESIEFVINLFQSTSKYKKRISALTDDQMKQTIVNHFVWLLSVAFADGRQLTNQQKIDINLEMARGARILSLFEIMSDPKYKMVVGMQSSHATEVKNLVGNMEALLMSCRVYSMEKDNEVQYLCELIEEKIAGIEIITVEERKMIHQAMAKSFHNGTRAQGHWCKCPNGHIYCITECGGPMQESICPECKVKIGGTQHRHVAGATVASEMDGAARLAWSYDNM